MKTEEPHWRTLAACCEASEEERSWFFGSDDEPGQSLILHRKAQRQFCFVCPVQVQCLVEGVVVDAPDGVWGGLTWSQRKRTLRPLVAAYGLSEETAAMAIDRVRQANRITSSSPSSRQATGQRALH